MSSQDYFERYLAATPDEDPESILETLLAHCAPPILKRVVRSRLGSLYTPETGAEVTSEAMLELLTRVRTLREEPGPPREFPFDALAAGVAANTVHRFFARRFPERNRLRKRLRYVVETDERFRLWAGTDGASVCALAGESPKEPLADTADVERCLDHLRKSPHPAHPLSGLVFQILRALVRPIDLSRLTGIAAEVIGIREPSFVSESGMSQTGREDQDSAGMPADPAPSAAMRMEWRQQLESLWRQVLQLSPRHRAALLFSARASNGAAAWLLVDLGTASFREIAAALELAPEELAEIWNRLPLDDREIAGRLGLERQQVINLRCTAREKLARRASNPGA